MQRQTAQVGLPTTPVRRMPTWFVRRIREQFALVPLPAGILTGGITAFGLFIGTSIVSSFASEIKNSEDCDAATDALVAQFLDKTWSADDYESISQEIRLVQVYCEEKKYSQVQQSLEFIERLMKRNR